MEKFQIFIQLTRLNKPIGFLLLFWPCAWGLTLGYYFSNETALYFKYIILFFIRDIHLSTETLKLHLSDMKIDLD